MKHFYASSVNTYYCTFNGDMGGGGGGHTTTQESGAIL